MRGFIVMCLVAVAMAAPQYSYDQGASGSSSGPGAGLAVGGGSLGGGSLGGGSLGGGGGGGGGGAIQAAGPIVYNKEFYIHSAPEDDGSDGDAGGQLQSSNRRNLRVVFIKTPENKGLENAALNLAKAASEDRTAIYVLNKQTDLGELQNRLNQIQDHTAGKPEVHFVKYKTPQEAEHAQHTIQAQFDQLGGPSQVSNEGIAPVHSFIGSLGNQGSSLGAGPAGSRGASGGYLPPLFRFRY